PCSHFRVRHSGKIDKLQSNDWLGMDNLPRRSSYDRKRSTQDLMTPSDVVHAIAQDVNVNRAANLVGPADGIARHRLWRLRITPNSLLKQRHWPQRVAPRRKQRRRVAGQFRAANLIDRKRESRHGRMVGKCAEVEFDSERVMNSCSDNRSPQRVAPQRKEVVMKAEITGIANLDPHVRYPPLPFT